MKVMNLQFAEFLVSHDRPHGIIHWSVWPDLVDGHWVRKEKSPGYKMSRRAELLGYVVISEPDIYCGPEKEQIVTTPEGAAAAHRYLLSEDGQVSLRRREDRRASSKTREHPSVDARRERSRLRAARRRKLRRRP
jgi:hypothetical protein